MSTAFDLFVVNRGLRFRAHLKLADHAVLHVGGHHHPVPRGVRELRALGWDTLGDGGPGPIVTDHTGVVTGLELGDTPHLH